MYAEHGKPVSPKKKVMSSHSIKSQENSKESININQVKEIPNELKGFGRGYKTEIENVIIGKHL
jgi:hypothetical protein